MARHASSVLNAVEAEGFEDIQNRNKDVYNNKQAKLSCSGRRGKSPLIITSSKRAPYTRAISCPAIRSTRVARSRVIAAKLPHSADADLCAHSVSAKGPACGVVHQS